MNGRIFTLLIGIFLLCSCSMTARAPLPRMISVGAEGGIPPQVLASFPSGRWQFVHSIAFHMAAGGEGTAIGVVALEKGEIRCALTTVEGLILFSARAREGEPVRIIRATPPFDKKGFAEGLVRDVRTIFTRPLGKVECGRLADGARLCRWSLAGRVTDVLPKEDGCRTINTYSDGIKVESVDERSCKTIASALIPEDIELVAFGAGGYSLDMHLVSAETLPAEK